LEELDIFWIEANGNFLMIYIKELLRDDQILVIKVDGVLDDESLPVLRKVCEKKLDFRRGLELDLVGLLFINREARLFLERLQKEGAHIYYPKGMGLEKRVKE